MAQISVLLIGASGALGKPILEELLRQKPSFARLGILTAPERSHKFQDVDVEVITSSLYEPATYKGRFPSSIPKVALPTSCKADVTLSQVSHMSSLQWVIP